MPPLILIASAEAHAREFATSFAALAAEAQQTRGLFSVAIPGGSVARAFLPALAGAAVDWRKVHVFWCDERAGARDSPDSNFALAREVLFATAARGAVLHPMPADLPDLAAAAELYREELERTLGAPPTFDLVLLGVGEDGHVASLFPDRREVEETGRTVLPVEDSPKPPPRRLSLALPVLLRAREVVIAAFGAGKAAAVAQARDPAGTSPCARVVAGARSVTLRLDPDAAGGGA